MAVNKPYHNEIQHPSRVNDTDNNSDGRQESHCAASISVSVLGSCKYVKGKD